MSELPAFCTFYHLTKLTLDLNLKKNIEEFARKASTAEISEQMLKKIIINDNNKHPLINPRDSEVLSDFKHDILRLSDSHGGYIVEVQKRGCKEYNLEMISLIVAELGTELDFR